MSVAAEAVRRMYCEHKCKAASDAGIRVHMDHDAYRHKFRFVWRFPAGNLLAGHYQDSKKDALFNACGMLP